MTEIQAGMLRCLLVLGGVHLLACSSSTPDMADATQPDLHGRDAVVDVHHNAADLTKPVDLQPPDRMLKHDAPKGLKTLWVATVNGDGADNLISCVQDSQGAVFAGGDFYGTTQFGPSFSLTSKGGSDVWVAKLSASGKYVWVRSAGGVGPDVGTDVAIDASNAVHITGSIAKQASFGPIVLPGGGGLLNYIPSTVFVSKLDSTGKFLWATGSAAPSTSRGRSVVVDAKSNVYSSGSFINKISWGSTTLQSAGMTDPYFVRFDTNGKAVWATSGGGIAEDSSRKIGLDSGGNIVAFGNHKSSSLYFGASKIANVTQGLFMTKIDPAGKFLWASHIVTGSIAGINDVVVNSDGSAYLPGTPMSKTFTVGTKSYWNVGDNDIFLAKIAGSGKVNWSVTAGSVYADHASGAAVDSNGNVYVTGGFRGLVSFGLTVLKSVANSHDVFVAKYSSTGKLLWVVSTGGDGLEDGQCIAVDKNGHVIVGGNFMGKASFGGQQRTANGWDAFVWKFIPP